MNTAHRKLANLFLWGLALAANAQSVPPLVNYQGRLSNPDGTALATADYQLAFNIYDAATNGALVWGPQVFDSQTAQGHGPRIPVVQGYFNVMLGPVDTNGVSLANAFSGTNRFIEVTVTNHSPILPRQQILTAPFAFQAANAATLAGYDWSAILVSGNNPGQGQIAATKIQTGGITASQIAPNTITSGQIANGTIMAAQLAGGAVTFTNLAPLQVGTNVGLGGFAISPSSGDFQTSSLTDVAVPNLSVTINCSGRPVEVFTVGGTNVVESAWEIYSTVWNGGTISLYRDGAVVRMEWLLSPSLAALYVPTSSFRFVDAPDFGSHTYSLYIKQFNSSSGFIRAQNVRLAAREL